ncbi:hypothetical protein ACFPK9_13765 [Rubritalea spongiae]|uniref:DUF1795 domain-containing protein n=1 Tax=Rubritalea spongiae TaxID=430797 RepID=A0ABW5E2W5_9BACT
MLRNFVIFCSAYAILSGPLLAEQIYEGNGFRFTYSDSEKVTVTGEQIKTLRIKNSNGSEFLIQNHGDSVTPEKLREMMNQSLLKHLENGATELTHKTAQRTIFGTPRNGRYILYSKNNIPSESLLFTFQQDGDTFCVITQMALQHSQEAERMFAQIQQSLELIKN